MARTPFRVRPSDIDPLWHMNNGVYLSIMDLGRIDLMRRSGMLARLRRLRWYPVVVAESITFRRSLGLWQRYVLETRLLGADDKAVLIEQRFVVAGEIAARAVVRGRFLRRDGGTVSIEELSAALGVAPPESVPAWVADWAGASALPPSRAAAPSVWDEP